MADDVDDRLMCAWCGVALSAVELIEHRSLTRMERWGWHHDCYDDDAMTDRGIPWDERRRSILSRGQDRVGIISKMEIVGSSDA